MTQSTLSPSFVEVKPLEPKAKKLVVFFHGVGSDAKDLISIVPYMQDSLPDAHFISLNGLQKYDMASFGYQWFSLKDREQRVMAQEVGKAVPLVINSLENFLQKLELSFEDLFLVGFSQGTMLATHIATSFDKRLAGVVGFAGAIIPKADFCGNFNTPICFIHGKEDEVLPIDLMYKSADYLKQFSFNVETHEIPFLTHSIDMQCIQIATKFIKNYYES